jgi:hypothetical protein
VTANIALNEEQFRTLVGGGIVADSGALPRIGATLTVKIILSDIGFAAMRKAIDDAEAAIKARLEAEEI